jgi:preprotein translocase subunit SecG
MQALPYIQVALAILTIVLVLIQERGGGMSGLLGGDGQGTYQSRRGVERIIFGATIASIAAFAVLALAQLYFAQ